MIHHKTHSLAYLQSAATVLLLGLALVFGGGQGTLGDTMLQLLALAVLLLSLWSRPDKMVPPSWTWLPVIAVVLVPVVQMFPIPLGVWKALGGRADMVSQIATVDAVVDPSVGLSPMGAQRALIWLLPAVAVYVSALRMETAEHKRLLMTLIAVASLSVVLGLVQSYGGPSSPLRFYANTNLNAPVGFFANRNHFAGLLALCLPLALTWTAIRVARPPHRTAFRLLPVASGIGACLLLILGLALARSRAGLMLGMLALFLTLPILFSLQQQTRLRRMLMAALIVAGTLVIQFGLIGILQRLNQDPLDDVRWGVAKTTLVAADTYSPAGTGLGTFRDAFPRLETQQGVGLTSSIVNHVHDDYVELWLETGWLFIPAVLLVLGTLGYCAMRAWRRPRGDNASDGAMARAATIAMLVPLLHSFLDYPLRTSAHLAVFGALAGIVVSVGARRSAKQPASDPPSLTSSITVLSFGARQPRKLAG